MFELTVKFEKLTELQAFISDKQPAAVVTIAPEPDADDVDAELEQARAEKSVIPQPQLDTPQSNDAPETDATGAVWDENIHASSRALNADGTWRRRRGGPVEPTDAVTTDKLGDDVDLGGGPESEPQLEPGANHLGDIPNFLKRTDKTDPDPEPAPEPAPEPNETIDFRGLMDVVGAAFGAKTITDTQFNELLAEHNLEKITDARSHPDVMASFANAMHQKGYAAKAS